MVRRRLSERWWMVVLAALSPWAAERVIALRDRTRHLFPPHGVAYELFDSSVLLVALGVFGYVLTDPPAATQQALAPLEFISNTQLGVVLAGAGLVGVICSYSTRTLRLGYVATITVAWVMAANFFIGFGHTVLGSADVEWRLVLSTILYGWIARRLMRDNSE